MPATVVPSGLELTRSCGRIESGLASGDLILATGGSSAARSGSRLERCFRDAAMFRAHIGAQYDVVFASTDRAQLAQPLTH